MRFFLQGVSLALMLPVAADAAALGEKGMTIRIIVACLAMLLAAMTIWEEP